jgi:chorismate mutase
VEIGLQNSESKLHEIRVKIDSIDDEILSLLNRRAELSIQIGKIKEQFGMPVYSAEREELLIKNICEKSNGPMAEEAIKKIFQLIIDESKKIQNRIVDNNQSLAK